MTKCNIFVLRMNETFLLYRIFKIDLDKHYLFKIEVLVGIVMSL